MDQHPVFTIAEFAAVKTGEPFRLLPFGTLVKGGEKHTITREYATQFKLPHFKPPVKLGSHDETTPAGGFLIGLEVREDGLYGIPEWNEAGEKAMLEGAYRYHSPEVLWKGFYEDPTTGAPITGPLIIGDALLHHPHLGESAALYTFEYKEREMDEVTVPKSLWEKLVSKFSADKDPVVEETEKKLKEAADNFAAATKERDTLQAKLEKIETDKQHQALVSTLSAELQAKVEDKQVFGASYVELKNAQSAAEMLASMSETQRNWVMTQFKAMAAQIDESKLTGELGSGASSGSDQNPVAVFDAAVKAKSVELKTDYITAMKAVAIEQPDVYAAYQRAGKEKK